MEVVSQLRIELYEELQALPEGLRSSFPDLAADFLAVVFKPWQRSKQPSTAATQHRPLVPFQLLVDAFRPAGVEVNGASFGLSDACLESIRLALADLNEVAVGTEAAAACADGWGDLALSALSTVTQTKPHDGDKRCAPSLDRQISPNLQVKRRRQQRQQQGLLARYLTQHRGCCARISMASSSTAADWDS
ncbi:hypothetical protein D9Q98_003875 [Chlorella vulgaris]|uniref:Uncharacterized protein n=1 Tax=Chlorella vulgaris TaxID=3077 RepID=A0A9D4TR70_CHLVU|nr:hypothetical protein D9Q98_003875 [Chlorella vulgaris]